MLPTFPEDHKMHKQIKHKTQSVPYALTQQLYLQFIPRFLGIVEHCLVLLIANGVKYFLNKKRGIAQLQFLFFIFYNVVFIFPIQLLRLTFLDSVCIP